MGLKKIGEIHKRKLIGENGWGKNIFINLCEYGPLGRKPGFVKDDGEKANCRACIKIIVDCMGNGNPEKKEKE